MRLGLLLLFLAVPLIELALLIKVGQTIGVWPTLAIVIGTAFVGGVVLHRQGWQTINRAMEAVSQGRPPIDPVIDGAFLLLAGGLLLSPGLITDAIGLSLLVPQVRRFVAGRIFRSVASRFEVRVDRWGEPSEQQPKRGVIIEGEYEAIDDPEKKKTPGNGPTRK